MMTYDARLRELARPREISGNAGVMPAKPIESWGESLGTRALCPRKPFESWGESWGRGRFARENSRRGQYYNCVASNQ